MSELVALESIKIGERHRRDLGDIRGLAASIAGVGLIHPIVVTPSLRLVAGRRRLEACRLLRQKKVPVYVIRDLRTARQLLEAERDENICRLEMTKVERTRLGMELEKLEKPRAERRMRAGKEPYSKIREGRRGRSANTTCEIVGAAVGLSGTSWERARAVIERADAGEPQAVEALKQLEKDGKITPAYERATGRKVSTGQRSHIPREKLKQVLVPVQRYLRQWDETQLHGTTPTQARRLLQIVQEIDRELFELERALETRTVVSRALR